MRETKTVIEVERLPQVNVVLLKISPIDYHPKINLYKTNP